jgi:hypothetical protein
MVLKKSRSLAAPKSKSLKNRAPAWPAPEPPEGLQAAIAACDAVASLPTEGPHMAPAHELPDAARRCLDALGAREHQPKRLATLPVQSTDAIVEAHAKRMRPKCSRCAELLREKYKKLEENKLGMELAQRELSKDEPNAPFDPTLFALLSCSRKSDRFLWMQPQQQTTSQALGQLFATALSARKPWPNALELDMENAACSRELQLPYKDERERQQIMNLHGKAQASGPIARAGRRCARAVPPTRCAQLRAAADGRRRVVRAVRRT